MEELFRRDENNPNIFYASSIDCLEQLELKNEGHEGRIYRCQIGNESHAIKEIKLDSLEKPTMQYSRKTNKIEEMLKLPKHDNFVRLDGLIVLEGTDFIFPAYVMEDLFHCESFHKFAINPKHPKYKERIRFLIQLSIALEWAHKNGIIIGDHKESNILLNPNKNYLPIFMDRDNNMLANKERTKIYPFDNMPPTMEDLLYVSKYTIPNDISGLFEIFRSLDISGFTIMALRVIFRDGYWQAEGLTKEMIKKRLNTMVSYGVINESEKEEFELLLSDSLDKPSPTNLLKRIQNSPRYWK